MLERLFLSLFVKNPYNWLYTFKVCFFTLSLHCPSNLYIYPYINIVLVFPREKSSTRTSSFCLSLSFYIYMPMEGEIYTEIYRHRFIIGIGLHSYGSLPPAICKLENREIWWCNSVRVQRPKNQESQGHKPQSKSEDLRTRANVWG